MTGLQKVWVLDLGVVIGTVLLSLGILLATGDAAHTVVGMAFAALSVLGRLFLRGKGEGVVVDERDLAIGHRAMAVGFSVFWVCFVVVFVAAALWPGQETVTFRRELLVIPVLVGYLVTLGGRSVAALLLYTRGV